MKTEKKKTLRGSVLFTVVCVMALLIIFLTGTLALASAAGNRAHRSYSTSQANYTARAAIESFAQAMKRDDGIAAAVQAIGSGSSTTELHPKVVIPDKSLGEIGYWDGSDWIADRIEITPVDNTEAYGFYDKDGDGKNEWCKVETVKVSATCKVGREYETVSAYIQKSPSNQNKNKPGGINGLQEVGGNTFANGALVTGGLGVGIGDSVADCYHFHNDATVEATLIYVNSNLCGGTSSFKINVLKPEDEENATKPYSQTVIDGSLMMENNSFINLQYEMTENYTQKEVPYLFINGMLTQDQSSDLRLVKGNNSPFNVFIGTLNPMGPVEINGDLYLMDKKDGTSYTAPYVDRNGNHIESKDVTAPKGVNYFGKPGKGGKLFKWTQSVVQRQDTQFQSVGGNIYCMGDLNLSQATIEGDVRVEGNCTIDNNVKINGDLVVAGTLTFNNKGNKRIVNGTIYSDGHTGDGSNDVSGYTFHQNELFPGYTEIPNEIFDNTEVPNCKEVKAEQRADHEYHWCIQFPDGTIEDYVWEQNHHIYVEEGTDNWYPEKPYYATYYDNGLGYDDTDIIVYNAQTKFMKNRDGSIFYELDGNGQPQEDTKGHKIVRTSESDYTYYNSDDELVAEKDARGDYYTKDGENPPKVYGKAEVNGGGSGTVEKYASYAAFKAANGSAYPTNMTRENIWGEKDASGAFTPANSDTKIIKTLAEVRKDLNFDDDGEYDPNIYYTDVPDTYLPTPGDNTSLPNAFDGGALNKAVSSGGFIDKSCIIGNADDYTTTYDLPETINIKASSEIWVVLKNVRLYSNKEIIVHPNGGKVNFLIDGAVKLDNNCAIRNANFVNGCTVRYDDDWGMEFFATEGASLDLVDPCCLTGTFKAPTLTISNKVAGPYTVTYVDEYGKSWPNQKPVIVGSALVSKVTDAQNSFSVLNSGGGGVGGGGMSVKTTFGWYDIKYFMGV